MLNVPFVHELIAQWCAEAMATGEQSWGLIQAYIQSQMANLSEADRQIVEQQLQMMLHNLDDLSHSKERH